MLINLSDVLSEQHKTVDETVQLEMDTFQSRTGTFPIVSKEPVHVDCRACERQRASYSCGYRVMYSDSM